MSGEIIRPLIHKNIAVYAMGKNFTPKAVQAFLSHCNLTYSGLKSLGVDTVGISLQNVEDFAPDSLRTLALFLEQHVRNLKIAAMICDYPVMMLETLQTASSGTHVSLFESLTQARILYGALSVDKESTMLVYQEDPDQRRLIATELGEYGYIPTVASTKEEVKRFREKGHFDVTFLATRYFPPHGKITVRVETQQVTYMIQGPLDTKAIERFNLGQHNRRIGQGHRLFIIDATEMETITQEGAKFLLSLAAAGDGKQVKVALFGLEDAKTPESVLRFLHQSGIAIYLSEAQMLADPSLESYHRVATESSGSGGLTKRHVTFLPLIIDSVLETLHSMAGIQAEKKGSALGPLTPKEAPEEMIASTIGFQGDLDGRLALLFSQQVAAKVAAMLFGSETASTEELLDALGEIANIIAGRIKSNFGDKSVEITITLPESFADIGPLLESTKAIKGITIEFGIETLPLYIFLYR